MPPIALGLILIAACTHVLRDLITKSTQDKQIFVFWFSLISWTFSAPFGVYFFWLHPAPLSTLLIPLGAGFLHCAYWIFYSRAYEEAELSQVYPIIRAAPVLVLLLAILFFGEHVTWLAAFGILGVTLGVFFVSHTKGHSFHPRFWFRKKHLRFAFLSFFTVSLIAMADKLGVRELHPLSYMAVQTASTLFLYSLYLFAYRREKPAFKSTWSKYKKRLLANSVVATVNYPVWLTALSISPVSYATGFRQIGVVFAVILGDRILKESDFQFRLIGSLLIFSGAMAIAFG